MSYLVPYNNSLGLKEEVLHLAFQITGEVDIPDDTYAWVEWYCANPLCNCNEAHIEIRAEQQGLVVAMAKVPFQYPLLPVAQVEELHTAYAPLLVRLLEDYLQKKPDFITELREHYHTIRAVAQDPQHPAFPKVKQWADTGLPPKAARKRHRRRD